LLSTLFQNITLDIPQVRNEAVIRYNAVNLIERYGNSFSAQTSVFTARRYANAACCRRASVRPSVCHTPVWYQNK